MTKPALVNSRNTSSRVPAELSRIGICGRFFVGFPPIDGVVAGRVDVLTDTQAIELDWLKGNKFHEGIGQALHYGDGTGQQPVLALISAYYNIFGAEQQKLEYVSGLCAAHGVEVWALTTERQ